MRAPLPKRYGCRTRSGRMQRPRAYCLLVYQYLLRKSRSCKKTADSATNTLQTAEPATHTFTPRAKEHWLSTRCRQHPSVPPSKSSTIALSAHDA